MKPGMALRVGGIISAVLVATAVVLYVVSRQNDPENLRRSIAHVQGIQQLATEWSVETARVRADPLADYDALVSFIPRMDELKRGLLAAVAGTPGTPDRLANDVSAYVNALEAKEERVERFKTANSVVRNSARYLPLAAAEIVQDDAADSDLARDVTDLAGDLADYVAAPTDAAKGRLTAVAERFGERVADLPDSLAVAVANFLSHARVLLDRQGPVDEMFAQATSADIADLSARLVGDLGDELRRLGARNALYTNGIFAAVAALLLTWIVLAMVRSRPAAEASRSGAARARIAAATDADPAAARAAQAVAEPAAEVEKVLLSQRIVADLMGRSIAEASREISGHTAAMSNANGAAEIVGRGADHIAALANGLVSFSQERDATYALVDINDCLDEALAATGADTATRVTIEKGAVPEVFAARLEICLVFEKVIENAVQAIRDKGLADGAKGEIRIATSSQEGRAIVTMIDNGIGMRPEVRARMFEPFYSAAEDRSGIGLTITAELVAKYEGSVAVNSHEGGGTVIRIEVPGMSATP